MKKISLVKYHQLNASIRTIRDFCIERACSECPLWKEGCPLHNNVPEDWEELPKEVLDKE